MVTIKTYIWRDSVLFRLRAGYNRLNKHIQKDTRVPHTAMTICTGGRYCETWRTTGLYWVLCAKGEILFYLRDYKTHIIWNQKWTLNNSRVYHGNKRVKSRWEHKKERMFYVVYCIIYFFVLWLCVPISSGAFVCVSVYFESVML